MLELEPLDNEIGGILAELSFAGEVEIIPLLAARGNSSSPLSAACYGELKGCLLEYLRQAGAVDGVILSHLVP